MPNVHDKSSALDHVLAHELKTLGEQLAAALKAQEWEAVAGIDLRIRDCLEAAAGLEHISPELQLVKSQVHALYGHVIPAYGNACEKLRQLLINYKDFAEGRSAYMRTELLQGEI